MKAVITSVKFDKEVQTKFGLLYKFKIEYSGKLASYLSKSKEQTHFVQGQESDFTEEVVQYQGKDYINVKPTSKAWTGGSGYAKAIKKEQSKYSGYAVSYVKDLIIADKIKIEQWESASEKIFNFMVKLDKSIQND
ncbi:MAG: hypothetical protein WC401_13175 [Bacteroidales bacterium]